LKPKINSVTDSSSSKKTCNDRFRKKEAKTQQKPNKKHILLPQKCIEVTRKKSDLPSLFGLKLGMSAIENNFTCHVCCDRNGACPHFKTREFPRLLGWKWSMSALQKT